MLECKKVKSEVAKWQNGWRGYIELRSLEDRKSQLINLEKIGEIYQVSHFKSV